MAIVNLCLRVLKVAVVPETERTDDRATDTAVEAVSLAVGTTVSRGNS
jgi:hypothetical protein